MCKNKNPWTFVQEFTKGEHTERRERIVCEGRSPSTGAMEHVGPCRVLFQYPISTSYCKISLSLEANCLIALKFGRHIGTTAADVLVKFQSDTINLNYQSRDLEIWR